MNKNILAGITTLLIIGSTSLAASAQRIDCFRNGDIIRCPGYGNFNYRNRNTGNNFNQTQIESSIREMYLQVLGRNADPSGLRAYTGAVVNNRLSLVQVRRQLVNSVESDRAIRAIYQQAGRNLNANQLRSAKNSIENGTSLDQLRQELLSSNNNNQLRSNVDQKEAIAAVYQQVLGRSPDNDGLGYYSESIESGKLSLLQVRRELVYSSESDQNINRLYQQILGRNVNANELIYSKQIMEIDGGSLDQVQVRLASSNEARSRNGDRTFSLRELLGIFK